MTGGRALTCVFCRILRVIEINRRISYVTGLRGLAVTACINNKRTITTSPWLYDRNKDTEDGSESSSSSSSDEEFSSNSSGSDSDSEKKVVKPPPKQESKGIDLFSLLSEMKASEERWGSQKSVKTNLKKIEHSIDEDLVTGAIKLSKELPGDQKQSEHDLISQLLGQFETTANQKQGAKPASRTHMEDKIQESSQVQKGVEMSPVQEKKIMPQESDESIDEELVTEPTDQEKSEHDTISKLLGQVETKDIKKQETKSLSKTLQENIQESPEIQKAIQKRMVPEKKIMPQEPDISTVLGTLDISKVSAEMSDKKKLRFRKRSELFQGKPLGIFTPEDMKSARSEKRTLFEEVAEEERNEMNFYPPSNAFEEQIQWTREGKLWTFPIDNEAGWEEEINVEFYEHVFLDSQLLDFPKKGPIRHFMELVTVALSKNPYLTVTQKHEHIDWYRNYFRSKYDLLEPRLGKDGVIQSQA